MMTRENLDLALNALTSIGTLAAVIVALYLARQESREVVIARAGIRMIIAMGQSFKDGDEVVCISVTNLTSRPVTITGVGWRLGIFKRAFFIQMHDRAILGSSTIPQKLDYGDSATYPLPNAKFFANFDEMAPHISLTWPWLSKRFLCVLVSTSGTRKDTAFRVDESLAARMLVEARKRKGT